MATVHKIKTVDPYFQEAWEYTKTFEVRFNDRAYKVGDEVVLMEYNAEHDFYSGREIRCVINYILEDFEGLKDGWIAFSIRPYWKDNNDEHK